MQPVWWERLVRINPTDCRGLLFQINSHNCVMQPVAVKILCVRECDIYTFAVTTAPTLWGLAWGLCGDYVVTNFQKPQDYQWLQSQWSQVLYLYPSLCLSVGSLRLTYCFHYQISVYVYVPRPNYLLSNRHDLLLF